MSDLIIIGYPDETTAENVWAELVKLQHDYLVDLEDAAIIRRDQKGKLHVTTPATTRWPGAPQRPVLGHADRAAVPVPARPADRRGRRIMGAALGAAGDLGIKDDFKQRVQDLVQPGTSALLVIVRKATPDKFLEALRPYGGTVLKTSLPRDAEQELMKALHGDDPAAPTWQHAGSRRRRVPRPERPPDCPRSAPGAAAWRSARHTGWTQNLQTPLRRFLRTETGGAAVLLAAPGRTGLG